MASVVRREGKNGTTYKAVIRIHGYPTQTKTFKRLTDARIWSEKTENAIRDGEFHNVVSEARRKTVADIIVLYRQDVLPNKASSTQRAENTYLKFWEREVGEYSLSLLKPEKISNILHKLSGAGDGRKILKEGEKPKKPKSRKTLKHYRDMLELLFKYAIKWGWTASNPVDGVNKITRINDERTRFLNDDEREAILAACKTSSNKTIYPVVVFALATGARKGEILGLTMEDLDLKRGVAILRDTKNTDTRAVPITAHLRNVLEEHIESVDTLYEGFNEPPQTRWLFPRSDGLEPLDIRLAWENARKEAKLVNFRFHDLRHSTASYLAMNGANQVEIAEILGHRTLQMVRRYAHLSDSHVKNIMEDVNKKLF
jgi:integrase